MPRSKLRKKHPSHHPHPPVAHPKPKRRAATAMAYFGALLGILIAMVSSDWSIPWILAGAAGGAVVGYLAGFAIDNALKK